MLLNLFLNNIPMSWEAFKLYIRLSYKKTCKCYLQRTSKYFSCKQNCEACFWFICANWRQKQNFKVVYCSLKNMNGTGHITFRSRAMQLLSEKIIMLINDKSNGNRKSIPYKSWNATIAVRYNGNRKHGMSGSKIYSQLYAIFLLSFIVTHLLSPGLRIKLQLLPISEMGQLHTLILIAGDWPFSIAVTRHFRPKPGHSN